jgi:hypothetical protein
LAFIVAQLASDVRRERSEGRLNERAIALEELIRTMPPADFIQLLVTTDVSARQTLQAVRQTLERDLVKADVKEAVRVVLHGLAVLAQRFDAGSLTAAYAANIMLFKRISDLRRDDPAQLLPPDGKLRFTPRGSPLQGVLDLDLELSAMPRLGVAREEKPDPDPLLKPLALPVPESAETRGPAPTESYASCRELRWPLFSHRNKSTLSFRYSICRQTRSR